MTERKYQIFISSTFADLQDERRSIMEVILSMGHIPAGMELFSAGNQEQWELIKERIEECDYYIVIVAQRYGSMTPEGISYTRKEYEFAREIGIPVAGFILHPDIAKTWPRHKCEPEQEPRLEEFKKLVRSLPTEYWTDAGDLKARCAVALPKLMRKNPRSGWVSGDQAMDAGLASELARLSAENEVLRRKLGELQDPMPQRDLRRLAEQMKEARYRLLVKLDLDDIEHECEEVDLLSLFLSAAPSLLIENSVRDLRRAFLDTSSQVREYRQSGKKTYWVDLNVGLGDTIIGEFANRGRVEQSARRHSLKDHHHYWTLTRLGSQLYRNQGARDTAEEAHQS